MTTTSDARKRLAEAERIAHPATIPGAVNDAAVEAAAEAMCVEQARQLGHEEMSLDETDQFLTLCLSEGDDIRAEAKAALTAARPHLRKDWEAPLRELIADAREDKRIHDITTAKTVGSDHRPCESLARLRFAERLEALLAPEVPE